LNEKFAAPSGGVEMGQWQMAEDSETQVSTTGDDGVEGKEGRQGNR